MPYMNTRLHALLAMGLLLLAAPALHAQEASAVTAEIRGDVNGDGQVTAADAEAVRAYLVRGTVPQGRSILPAGDANGDGRVTAADAALISRFAAGADVSRFPVGRAVGDERVEITDITRSRLTLLDCSFSAASGQSSCEPATGGGGDALLDIIVGTPSVQMASSFVSRLNGSAANPDTSTFLWTLTNKMDQPIGTTDGTTADPGGSRVFFLKGPTATSAVAGNTRPLKNLGVTPVGPVGTFVSAQGTNWTNRRYFQFDGLIKKDSSVARQVSFVYDPKVLTFNFQVLIETPVPFDLGRVILTPLADTIVRRDTSFTIASRTVNHLAKDTADVLSWSSSNPAVASVDANTGVVTTLSEGTTTITATDVTKPTRTSASQKIIVDRFPEVSSTTPADNAVNIGPDTDIVVTFTEAVNVTATAFELKCPAAGAALPYTIAGSGTTTITVTPDADLPSGTVCEVTVKGNQVSDVDTNDGPNFMPGQYVFDFEVGIQALNDAFGTTTTGNVRINSASTDPVFSVTANDKIGPSTTITFAGWAGNAGKTEQGGDVVMTTSGAGMGQFTYNPPAGYTGTDSVEYTIASGSSTSSAKVALPVSGMIWFVNNGGAACTSRANGCGRLTNPYSTLAAFQAENNGTGNNPAAGDNIFLYESASSYTGPVTLLADQKLIGQDAGASLSTITSITPATGSDPLPGMNPGANAVTVAGAAGGVVLGSNNLLRGFSLSTTGGTALAGINFGTPTIAEVPVSATGGAALSLENGTLNSTFPSVTSTGSAGRGISLTNVNGTPTFTAGSLSGSAQAAFFVSGGNVTFTWPGTISQANNAPLVDVQGSHNGALVFSGTLGATNGAGLQFNAAQGTYTFSGTTTLGGTDAGIDITNGSGGTFTFGTGTAITNSAGTGVNVYGSAATVTYSGNITKSGTSTGRLVEIGEQTGGTVTFNTGTLSANSTSNLSTGISLSNADGTVNFNGTVTLSGGDAGVDIVSGSSAAISFGSGTSITNPSGEALRIFNGSGGDQPANVTFAGSITTNAGRPVLIEDVLSGTVAVTGSINATAGLGILVQNNSGGTMTFSNATQSLTTAANAAVTLTNNTGATVNFTGGSLVINTAAGAGFNATGGGTVNVTGAANRVTSTLGGTPVSIQNTTIGGSGVTFFSVTASGSGPNGIVLANTGAGAFQVTGDGASDPNNTTRGRTTAKEGGGSVALASGGNISGRSGHGVSLSSTGPVILRNMVITGSGSSGDGINASSTGRLTVDNTRITGHASDHGILGNSVGGFALHHSEVDNNGTTAGVVEGPDIWNLRLLEVTGTDTVRNSNIHHSQENVFGIINTTGTLNLTVVNTNITDTGTGAGGSIAMYIAANGSSNVTANFQNDSINRGRARGIQTSTQTAASATLNLTVNGSQFHNNDIAIENAHGSSGTSTFNITNNNLQTNVVGSGQAININRLASGSFNSFGLFTGTVSGNTIGTAGTANSGSDTGSGIEVESNGSGGITRVAIVNNTIREVGLHGIYVAAVDANAGGTAPPTLEARVASNTISNMDALGLDGIHVLPGALNTDDLVMCVDIANNNSTGIRNGLRVRPSGLPAAPSTVQLEGWDGVTAVPTYFTSRPNTLAGGTAAISTTAPPAPGGFVAVANCNTP